ncbi:uncharacterized protein [Ptychodera flava]|uniref:uncharacterized protein n=1 Tax=Ptychodera flava TaxID=63121 RepID=UPI00396A3214
MAAFDPPLILVLSVILCCLLSGAFTKKYPYNNCLMPSQDIRIAFPEDAEIGTTVFSPPIGSFSIQHGLIFEGNTDERFEFYANTSTFRLQKYLDYSNHKEFHMTVGWYQITVDENNKTCVIQQLYIEIEDKDIWPPYFNESCNLPSRDVEDDNIELPWLVRYGSYGLRTYTSDMHLSNMVWMDANFKDCSCIIFIAIKFTKEIVRKRFMDQSDLRATCFDGTTNLQRPEIPTVRLYRDFDDFPNNSAIDRSVLRKYHSDHPLLEIQLTGGLNLLVTLAKKGHWIGCHGTNPNVRKVAQTISFSAKPIGCPIGKYGALCEKQCICENGATCHTFTGACLCPIQWKGAACDIPKSRFIKFEKPIYQFHINQYSKIDCVFYQFNPRFPPSIEWFHNGSLISPRFFTIKQSPQKSCIIKMGAQDFLAGTYDCVVRDEYNVTYNDSTLVEILGCNDNLFGEKCNKVCNCNNSRNCDRIKGCECLPGWRGDRCDIVCEEGKYGEKCASNCSCHNNGSCDAITGECQCLDQTCGQFCEVTCSCSLGETFECDNVTGCTCTPSEFPAIADSSLNSDSKIIAVVMVSLVAFILIMAAIIVLAYRKYRGKATGQYRQLTDEHEIDEIIKDNSEQTKNLLLDPADVTVYFDKGILGQGEFSQVFPAGLKIDGNTCDVAVKMVTKSTYDYISYTNFREEVLRLRTLDNHPNIIKLHGIILRRDTKYMVLEYASRGDMFAYIKCLSLQNMSKTEEGRLVKLTRDVTLALQYLDEKAIVHRDVAARNVLITEDYVAKLADFGLSRELACHTGEYVKVPWSERQGPLPLKWMPPEFLTRGIFKIKSDIWSFGILMWEIATLGATPYGNIPPHEFIKILGHYERLRRPEACSEKWFSVMQKCWNGPLQIRPSAKALTGELDDVMTSDEKIFLWNLVRDLDC